MSMIQPIPGLISGAAQIPAAAAGVKEPPKVQAPEDAAPVRSRRPMMDEYVPEERREPSGRYWLGRDEGGQPKIFFDDPERAVDAPERQTERPDAGSPGRDQGADGPVKRASGKKAESCTGNTDRVDREIERLKRKKAELEQQISAQTDDSKIKGLEQKLAQVERELSQKDNDTYRRQHTVFS